MKKTEQAIELKVEVKGITSDESESEENHLGIAKKENVKSSEPKKDSEADSSNAGSTMDEIVTKSKKEE